MLGCPIPSCRILTIENCFERVCHRQGDTAPSFENIFYPSRIPRKLREQAIPGCIPLRAALRFWEAGLTLWRSVRTRGARSRNLERERLHCRLTWAVTKAVAAAAAAPRPAVGPFVAELEHIGRTRMAPSLLASVALLLGHVVQPSSPLKTTLERPRAPFQVLQTVNLHLLVNQ